jgi:phage terminase small subunit
METETENIQENNQADKSSDRSANGLTGQQVLPDLVALFGYDSAELKTEHEIFVRELVKLGNATEAYLAAYPSVSRSVARRSASRLLTNDDIRRRFEQVKKEVVTKVGYNAESAYRDLVRIATFDRRKLYDELGNLKPVHELDDDAAYVIDSIEETRSGSDLVKTKINLPKRLEALDKILRYHGAYKDKVELTGKDGGAIKSEAVVTFYIPSNGRD